MRSKHPQGTDAQLSRKLYDIAKQILKSINKENCGQKAAKINVFGPTGSPSYMCTIFWWQLYLLIDFFIIFQYDRAYERDVHLPSDLQ